MSWKTFKNMQIKLLFVVLSILLLFITSNQVWAYKENEMYERTIRGTEIIHVILDQNANNNDVLNYIQNNITFSFDNSVSNTPSYNTSQYSSVHWYIKDSDDELLAVYFDGGSRAGRDENYDFIDLRWLGNGSPHMYCFWKMNESKEVLEHNDIIKAKHFKNNNPILAQIMNYKKLKNFTIKNIMKKIAEKVMNKTIKGLSFGNFFITGASGIVSEKLVDIVGDILEQNPEALEQASQAISNAENFIMGCVDFVDDLPGVRNLARTGLEGWKTVGKANDLPVNIFKEVGKSVSQKDYKDIGNLIENPIESTLNLTENLYKGTQGVVEGTLKATSNTLKDVGYGLARCWV